MMQFCAINSSSTVTTGFNSQKIIIVLKAENIKKPLKSNNNDKATNTRREKNFIHMSFLVAVTLVLKNMYKLILKDFI